MINRYHVIAVVLAAAAIVPARIDPAGVRSAYDHVGRFLARAFGFTERENTRDLRYYLDLEITAEQRTKGAAELKRAAALAEAGQHTAALQSLDRAAAFLPNLGDWLNVFAATAAAHNGDTTEVSRRLELVDSTVFNDWSWRTRIHAYRSANDTAGATRLAQAAAQPPGSPRRRSEAFRALGEMALAAGDSAAAATAYSAALDAWPNSSVALDAARALSDLPGLRPEHHLRIGRIYLRFGNLQRGVHALHNYLASGVAPADSAARLRLEIARAQFSWGQYRAVIAELRDLPASVPAVAAEALYLTGRAQYRAGAEEESQKTLKTLIARYPQQPASAQALFLLGDLSQDDRDMAQAESFFRRATAAAPTSEPAGIAHMRLSASALSQANYDQAVLQLSEYLRAFPAGPRRQQAAFWLGRTQLALGQRDSAETRLREARDLDPFSFYGLRAADLLQDPIIDKRIEKDPATEQAEARSVAAALVRFELLQTAGWNDAASFELDRMRQFFNDEDQALYSLAEGLNERNRTVAGITIGRELLRRAEGRWNRRLLRIVYPMPYRDLIEKTARSRGIDPYFMAALIRQESMFNPTATSGAGAMGLMQVMPSTGRSLARTLGIRGYSTEMLHVPETNLSIGSRFLADMIRSWGGRADYVLAAYNAGPARMTRWRQFPEASDPDLFLERIPFDETRDYVRVVQLNTRIYETLYGSPGSAAGPGN